MDAWGRFIREFSGSKDKLLVFPVSVDVQSFKHHAEEAALVPRAKRCHAAVAQHTLSAAKGSKVRTLAPSTSGFVEISKRKALVRLGKRCVHPDWRCMLAWFKLRTCLTRPARAMPQKETWECSAPRQNCLLILPTDELKCALL